jgi:hypothetical protein
VEPWSIGLVALIIIGLGVIIFGALYDRARNRRRAAEMLAPPPRVIPRLSAQAPSPAYLSELQARRAPGGGHRDLTPTERAAVDAEVGADTTVTIRAGYASRDFITDAPSSRAVLDDPLVAVCAGAVQSVRELLPVLERASRNHRSLVIVAESFAPEVTATLEVNAIQRTLPLVAVVAGVADVEAVARASRAMIIDTADRRSGYLAPDQLGSCARWISTATASHLIASAAHHQTA